MILDSRAAPRSYIGLWSNIEIDGQFAAGFQAFRGFIWFAAERDLSHSAALVASFFISLSIHVVSSVSATASMTGPTKMPISPNESRPPTTPAKTSSSGKLAPLLIKIGRNKLYMVPAMIVQTSMKVPQAD